MQLALVVVALTPLVMVEALARANGASCGASNRLIAYALGAMLATAIGIGWPPVPTVVIAAIGSALLEEFGKGIAAAGLASWRSAPPLVVGAAIGAGFAVVEGTIAVVAASADGASIAPVVSLRLVGTAALHMACTATFASGLIERRLSWVAVAVGAHIAWNLGLTRGDAAGLVVAIVALVAVVIAALSAPGRHREDRGDART